MTFPLSQSSSSSPFSCFHSIIFPAMKQLLRKLSKVADSPQYSLLRADARPRRRSGYRRQGTAVPEGHLPVYVGDEMERFVVCTELLNHPVFVDLLERSAEEYGYEQKGALHIPCHVLIFEQVLEALRVGSEPPSLLDLRPATGGVL